MGNFSSARPLVSGRMLCETHKLTSHKRPMKTSIKKASRDKKLILWFDEIGIEDVPLVGGKNASLGEMFRKLGEKGVHVPGGFAITAKAYKLLLKEGGIEAKMRHILTGLNTHDITNLQERGKAIRELVFSTKLPPRLEKEILGSFKEMKNRFGKDMQVAVRSSATAEDLPDASFAGQQETYLNIRTEEELLHACRKCFASLFTDRAISYRHDKGFGHFDVYLSIAVQKMVRSDTASSGVIFTIDPESGFKDVVLITGSYGLGENVVQGTVNPDEFYVFKPTLKKGFNAIIDKKLGQKAISMIYGKQGKGTINVETPKEKREKFCLENDDVLILAKWACIIEDHYKKRMDIEWAKDGDGKNVGTGRLFIVQARPETVQSQHQTKKMEDGKEYFLDERYQYDMDILDIKKKFEILCKGKAVGFKVAAATASVINSVKEMHKFKKGSILVTKMTDPDWEPMMKMAAGIITEQGGRTCHAAIISRELGIPCIVGTQNATSKIKTGHDITLSCAEGEEGIVYKGIVSFKVHKNWLWVPKTKTKIMMNAGIPGIAFFQSQIPNDGVGLAREEFIINSHIGIHPLALVHYDELCSLARKQSTNIHGSIEKKRHNEAKITVREIDKITKGYSNKTDYFVEKLAFGIARIGAAFYPNDVIVRMSDFKTNEYANLIGGKLYEPNEMTDNAEHNPMIGWRGASRYYDPKFRPAFSLECKAMKRVRNIFGLTNIKAMIPFCRTPEEGKRVIEIMKNEGLCQKENGFEIYVMAEIPSNCVDADRFAEIFDGFSIGSNDLTQLTLGLDRDSGLVSHIYSERESAVKRLIKMVISAAKAKGKKIGICGQAPSDFPDFAEFLIECGINSISLNPDTAVKTRLLIAEKEKALGIK